MRIEEITVRENWQKEGRETRKKHFLKTHIKRLGGGREISEKFSGGIMKVEGNMEECHESKEDNYFETFR